MSGLLLLMVFGTNYASIFDSLISSYTSNHTIGTANTMMIFIQSTVDSLKKIFKFKKWIK